MTLISPNFAVKWIIFETGDPWDASLRLTPAESLCCVLEQDTFSAD